MEKQTRTFKETVASFKPKFWLASIMELFERWAWYGLFAVLALYLTGSTDKGGLGFTHVEKGEVMGYITAILYLLPLFTGVLADRIGYKKTLIIAYVILISGYYSMGQVTGYWAVFFVFLYISLGAALFKPVASAIVSISTDDENATMGFGIFYMMVNIGGFIGPAMSSGLRDTYGWNIIFVQAAVVIFINLLIVLFFYKEEPREKSTDSFGEAVSTSLKNIGEALSDTKLSVLLIIMVGFWTMFNQLFYTLPTFIEDWVDTSGLATSVNNFWPWLGGVVSEGGQIKPEWFTNIDAFMIIFLQMIVSYFVIKMRHVSAMIRGFIIAAIGIGITFYTSNEMYLVLGVAIFAIGEMTTNPTFSSFIAIISPKGKEALYQGTYFLPVFVGNFFTKFVSGDLYQAWSDKLALLQMEMAAKGIAMQDLGSQLTRDQFLEKTAKATKLSVDQVVNQFVPENMASSEWEGALESVKFWAKNIDGFKLGEIGTNVSKNDYFQIASQKLGMTQDQMTQMLWDAYGPNKIWMVIVGIGAVTILALVVYDNMVIKPKERAAKVAE